MGKLEGKIALVTGGNSGIGLATAKQFVDVSALVYKLLRRRKANAAIATGNERDFPFELAHALLLCSEDVHASDDACTPVLYLGAGKELPNCFARARR